MSLSKSKELADKKTKRGKMVNKLYDLTTAERIKSKTSDAAITKSLRLDEIIEGLSQQKGQRKPRIHPLKKRRWPRGHLLCS